MLITTGAFTLASTAGGSIPLPSYWKGIVTMGSAFAGQGNLSGGRVKRKTILAGRIDFCRFGQDVA